MSVMLKQSIMYQKTLQLTINLTTENDMRIEYI